MLLMMSDAFVSLGRDTIDVTRAYGRSDASVVALVAVASQLVLAARLSVLLVYKIDTGIQQ